MTKESKLKQTKTTFSLNRNGIARPLIPYLGSKWRIAPKIIANFPKHQIYNEPYGGAAAVLLSKTPAPKNEIYNELNDDLVNLFSVLRNQPGELIRALKYTPYAEAEYLNSYNLTNNPIEKARRLVIRAHFCFHVRAILYEPQIMRYYASRTGSAAVKWQGWIRNLPAIVSRLRNVTISNQPALTIIKKIDCIDTLHYVDPPYLSNTRSSDAKYQYEMTDDDHQELLETLQSTKGSVVLSGYANPLYDQQLKNWRRIIIPTQAFSTGKLVNTEEILWIKNSEN